MPDTQNRRGDEFAKYDAMSTEELQRLLREDASKPVGEESDTDVLFYVMEVLAKRRKERNEGKSPEEALESFKHNYYTENEISSDSASTPAAPKRSGSGRWRKGLIAAAAMLAFVVGGSLTANAMGFDLWEVIAKWTQETFHLGYVGQTNESDNPSPDYANSCASLQEALDNYDVEVAIAPSWIPEGYIEGDIRITESPMQRLFKANYESGSDIIVIRIADYLDKSPTQLEQSDSLLEIYTVSNIDYYIFENGNQLQAAWINENFECYISGPISISEIKTMIDSIGKG